MYAVGSCAYKHENDMLPELFKDMFVKVIDVHENATRKATTDQLHVHYHLWYSAWSKIL